MGRTGMHFDVIERFERELGLPDRWYFSLMSEPPWSFVIKLHALFEAALSHVLEAQVDQPALKRYLARANMGGSHGKVELAKELELLTPKQVRFIRELSDMRNMCVHDIRNVQFQLDSYFNGLSSSEQLRLLSLMEEHFAQPVGDQVTQVPREQFMRDNLKLAVWITGSKILAELFEKRELAKQIGQLPPGVWGEGVWSEGAWGQGTWISRKPK